MSDEKESLSGDLTAIRADIAALVVRLVALENAPLPPVPTFPDYNGAISDLHTQLDAVQGRLDVLEVSPVSTADRAAAPNSDAADFGVDPIWIKAIFEKYFWNEKPVAPASVTDDSAG